MFLIGMHIQLSGEDRASERSTHKCPTAERQVPIRSGVHGRFDGAEANWDQEVHREKWQLHNNAGWRASEAHLAHNQE